jgi:hypothetical protein
MTLALWDLYVYRLQRVLGPGDVGPGKGIVLRVERKCHRNGGGTLSQSVITHGSEDRGSWRSARGYEREWFGSNNMGLGWFSGRSGNAMLGTARAGTMIEISMAESESEGS